MYYNATTGVSRQSTKKPLMLVAVLTAALFSLIIGLAPSAQAIASTLVVDESNNQGWMFNPDPVNATPYMFTNDEASIGEGSLYVEPIGSTSAHKFIALKNLGVLNPDFHGASYDFMVAGDGVDADAQHFYLNVYTNLAGSTAFYDCRFDYVPTTGSTTTFTTFSVTPTDTPSTVTDRFPADPFVCPATLAEMPADSTVKMVTINLGDASINDEGLAGYFDNLVLSTGEDVTTYDLEHITLSGKEACKKGGWMTSLHPVFKNQGDCVSYFATGGRNAASGE